MTASHMNILANPVKLIGLPPTQNADFAVATMGVTSRVFSRHLLAAAPRAARPSRCLFGSPEPGEIKQMLQRETQRIHDNFKSRYNFDVTTGQFVTPSSCPETTPSCDNTTTNASSDDSDSVDSSACQHKNLIQLEMEAHLERLDRENCNKNNTSEEELTENVAKCNSANSGLKENHKFKCQQRSQPYTKQRLITDSFAVRKSVAITNPSIMTMPKPQRAKLMQILVEEQQRHQEQAKNQKCEHKL